LKKIEKETKEEINIDKGVQQEGESWNEKQKRFIRSKQKIGD